MNAWEACSFQRFSYVGSGECIVCSLMVRAVSFQVAHSPRSYSCSPSDWLCAVQFWAHIAWKRRCTLSPQASLDERIASTCFSAGISRALSLRVGNFGRKSVAPYQAMIDSCLDVTGCGFALLLRRIQRFSASGYPEALVACCAAA
jgi:hypothetical protein